MVVDCSKYIGKCICGREHSLDTKKIVVGNDALKNFEQLMEEVGLGGKRRAVVYDSNIYKITEGKHVKADQEIVLPAQGLRSEDVLIEKMMEELDNPEVIVAYGAGTIMDFGRYPAYKLGIPFVAIPTLASSDGFTANICSVIIDGQKKSIPMLSPTLVVVDLDIIKGAPKWLVVSGVNDILAKYISLLDWKIAHLVSGEYYCPMVAELGQDALDTMRAAADKMATTGEIDHEAMTMAQMKGGLTMQLLNHSRAASGAEHLLAHLVEMHPPGLENAEGIHGQCVGVGTFLCLQEYRRVAKLKPKAKAFEPLSEEWIREKFSDRLAAGIIKENENDVLKNVDPQRIIECWDEICTMIESLPQVEEMEKLYEALDSKFRPEHIGIDPSMAPELLPVSAAIRNRLTFQRMLRLLDFE